MFLLYPSLGGKLFSVFRCLRIYNTSYFLPSMEYKCYEGHHAVLLLLTFIFIGLYILGIPTCIYYILENKEKLQEKATLDLYGSLYSQYQPEYWYWEIIEMLRKVFLCGGILTIAAGTSFSSYCGHVGAIFLHFIN